MNPCFLWKATDKRLSCSSSAEWSSACNAPELASSSTEMFTIIKMFRNVHKYKNTNINGQNLWKSHGKKNRSSVFTNVNRRKPCIFYKVKRIFLGVDSISENWLGPSFKHCIACKELRFTVASEKEDENTGFFEMTRLVQCQHNCKRIWTKV